MYYSVYIRLKNGKECQFYYENTELKDDGLYLSDKDGSDFRFIRRDFFVELWIERRGSDD